MAFGGSGGNWSGGGWGADNWGGGRGLPGINPPPLGGGGTGGNPLVGAPDFTTPLPKVGGNTGGGTTNPITRINWNQNTGGGPVVTNPDGSQTMSLPRPTGNTPWGAAGMSLVDYLNQPRPEPAPHPDIAAQQGQYGQDQADTYAAINAQLGQQAGLPQPGVGATGANQTINQLNQQAATGDFTGQFDANQMGQWQYAVDSGAISEALMRQLKTMPPDQAAQIAMNKVKEMNLRPGGNAYQWFG